jgi:DNA polymerase-3 subunit alpha
VTFTRRRGATCPASRARPGRIETSWFIKEVQRRSAQALPAGIPAAVQERADFEVEVIIGKGYPGYFLVVADFINWAKDQRHPGRPGPRLRRGLDVRLRDGDHRPRPDPHGLLFERFLNPERPSMPDFDVDFDERRRGEVIRYVTEKYGEDRVAQIVTYGTIKAKQAVKDAARVMGHPFAVGEKLTKAMPAA